jgi:hypothetical protein
LRLGSVDARGGVLPWNPGVSLPNPQGYDGSKVLVLLPNQGTLYVGGYFTGIAGQPRTNLASFGADGSLTSWDPELSQMDFVSTSTGLAPVETGSVNALLVSGGVLYVGGSFATVSGVSHQAIATFDSNGDVTAWNPGFGLNSIVGAMAMNAGVLYVGGYFNQGMRNQLAAFDSAGNLTDWTPNLSPARGIADKAQQIYALSVVGDTLYVGGDFAQSGTQARANLAAVDSAGNILDWNPLADGPVYALARDANTLYAGGQLRTMCGQTRAYLAAIDAFGKLTDWNPGAGHYVTALAASGDVVYVGGMFSSVGGQPRSSLAAVGTDGTVTPWNPSLYAHGWVEALTVSGGTIYVGGDFSSVAGQPRSALAAIDPSGNLLPWNPKGFWSVEALAVMGDLVYVAGSGDKSGTYLAAYTADGGLSDWTPNPDDYVYALSTSGGTLYVGGYFTTIAGEPRNDLAAFDASGKLLPWNPGAGPVGNGVLGLAVLANTVYAIGDFTTVTGQPRNGAAAIGTDGILAPWDPSPDVVPSCVAASDKAIFVGGPFTSIVSKPAAGFAQLSFGDV